MFLVVSLDTSLVNPASQLSDATQQEKATAEVAEAMKEGEFVCSDRSIMLSDITDRWL